MDFIQAFFDLARNLVVVYFFILIGIVWRFSPLYQEKFTPWFTTIAIWILFPIIILSSFSEIESFTSQSIIFVIFLTILIHIISYITIYLMSRNLAPSEIGARVLCSTFPNALLFPFPIIIAMIGSSALFTATIFVFVALVLRNTLGVYLGVYYGSKKVNTSSNPNDSFKIDVRKIIVDTFRFPPFIALILGFILYSIYGHTIISTLPNIEFIKNLSLYGSLLIIGFSFEKIEQLLPRNLFSKDILEVSIPRFVISPLFAGIILLLVNAPPLVSVPLFIQSMAPPAVSNILYGQFFHFDAAKISQLITSLTLLALLILPLELVIILLLFPF